MSLINFYQKKDVKKYDKKYHNPHFEKTQFKHPMRCLIVGSSGSGKTATLMNIIKSMNDTFDFIILAVKTRHEPLYEYLLDKCRGSIFLFEDGKIPNMEDIDKITENGKYQTLVIYDDLVLEKDQRQIEQAFIRARKKNCSLFYLSQSYFRSPKTIRINCDTIILKKLSTKRDLKMILKDYEFDLNEKQLMDMYSKCTQDFLNFMTIRLNVPNDSPYRITCNFTNVIQ